jgi:hypothetical protein
LSRNDTPYLPLFKIAQPAHNCLKKKGGGAHKIPSKVEKKGPQNYLKSGEIGTQNYLKTGKKAPSTEFPRNK